MPEHDCVMKEEWGKQKQDHKRYDEHLGDAPEYRDRILKVEISQREMTIRMVLCGVIGGLVGGRSPEAIMAVVRVFTGH